MSEEFKQWKIQDLIRYLQKAKKAYGNLPLTCMCDEEGNRENLLGEIGETLSLSVDNADNPTKATIWPF